MIKISNKRIIEVRDWDDLVTKTYGRRYVFQQQVGCQDRGLVDIKIPDESDNENMHDSIPEIINGEEMCVKFNKWLDRNPKQPIKDQEYNYELDLFWERNFYPELQAVANDLFEKGLIEAGEYTINIDW